MEFSVIVLGHGGIVGYPAFQARGTRSTVHIYGSDLAPDLHRVVEGGHAVDLTVIPMARLIGASLNGPLLDTTIPAGEVDRCPVPSAILAAGLEGTFGLLARQKRAEPAWSGLDSVGTATYLAYWRVKGAKIGQRRGGVLAWEGGEEQPIATA